VYDLSKIANFLGLLNVTPIPFLEIETRKLDSKQRSSKLPKEVYDIVLDWKSKMGIQSSDESEYRYMLRDFGLIEERPLDNTDLIVPMGGDGPVTGCVVTNLRKTRVFYLSRLGQELVDQYQKSRPTYEGYLFWLILRNKYYTPLLQQIISDPKSYSESVDGSISSLDSVSINAAKSWARFLGIISIDRRSALIPESLARLVLFASILELNHQFIGQEPRYVREISRILEKQFGLTASVISFTAILSILFRHTSRESVSGFISGRGDAAIDTQAHVQLIRFLNPIPISTAEKPTVTELLKILILPR
jgi:uncharacterized membrane protein